MADQDSAAAPVITAPPSMATVATASPPATPSTACVPGSAASMTATLLSQLQAPSLAPTTPTMSVVSVTPAMSTMSPSVMSAAHASHPSSGALVVPRFITNEASRQNAAFGTPSRFDSQRARFGPKQPVYDLEGALKRYNELDCKPSLGFDPAKCSWADVSARLNEAQAEYEKKAKAPGLKGLATRASRAVGNGSDSFTPALEMLPDDYGLSVVRGALTWMFLLTKQRAEKREAILAAFKQVPETIRNAETSRRQFRDDVFLQALADQLNDTVLEALSKMIRFLLPTNVLKKVFPVFADAPSAREIDDELRKIREATAAVQSRCDLLVTSAVVDTQKMVKQQGSVGQVTSHNAFFAMQHSANVLQAIGPMQTDISNINKRMGDMHADILSREHEAFSALTSAVNQSGIDSQNTMHGLLTEAIRNFNEQLQHMYLHMQRREDRLLGAMQMLELELYRARTPSPGPGYPALGYSPGSAGPGLSPGRLLPAPTGMPSPQMAAAYPVSMEPALPRAVLSAPELLELLGVPPERMVSDLAAVVREGMHLDGSALIQVQSLLKMDRFWQWFSSDDADLLMVDGMLAESPTAGRISPLSALCATLIGSLVQARSVAGSGIETIPLYFFCGMHISVGDGLAGPQGLMRCLLARLLLEAQAAFAETARPGTGGILPLDGIVTDPAVVEALRRYDLAALCQVFRLLAARFPQRAGLVTRLYCVVDGFSWYERVEMLEGIYHVVQMLSLAVGEPSQPPQAPGSGMGGVSGALAPLPQQPILKVLLTSPFPSRRVAPGLLPHQRLFLRPLLVANDAMPERMLMASFLSRVPPSRAAGHRAGPVGGGMGMDGVAMHGPRQKMTMPAYDDEEDKPEDYL